MASYMQGALSTQQEAELRQELEALREKVEQQGRQLVELEKLALELRAQSDRIKASQHRPSR